MQRLEYLLQRHSRRTRRAVFAYCYQRQNRNFTGAAILRNTRRIRLMLASHHPMRAVFIVAARRLADSSP